MATVSAVAATTEAIIRLLRSSFNPADFNNTPLNFQVYVADDFLNPMDEGVSLLLYRIITMEPIGRHPADCRPMDNAAAANCRWSCISC